MKRTKNGPVKLFRIDMNQYRGQKDVSSIKTEDILMESPVIPSVLKGRPHYVYARHVETWGRTFMFLDMETGEVDFRPYLYISLAKAYMDLVMRYPRRYKFVVINEEVRKC